MAERAEYRGRLRLLLAFALGSFHASALLLAVLAVAHLRGALGGLLDGLSSVAGFALFALLWLLTTGAGAGALRGLKLDPPPGWGRIWARGLLWGGLAGAAVVVAPLLFTLPRAVASGGIVEVPLAVALLLLYGAAAAGVAFLVGAVVGFLLATLDRALLALALICEPRSPGTPRRAVE